jgi:hypothetical protein
MRAWPADVDADPRDLVASLVAGTGATTSPVC